MKRPSKPEKTTTTRAGRRLRAADELKAKQAALHSALAKVVGRVPRHTFPAFVPPVASPQPAIGTYRIDQLRQGQCRFACTADDVPRGGHRFCGASTEIGFGNLHGSWCPAHLPHVLSSGGAGWLSRAEAAARREARAAA